RPAPPPESVVIMPTLTGSAETPATLIASAARLAAISFIIAQLPLLPEPLWVPPRWINFRGNASPRQCFCWAPRGRVHPAPASSSLPLPQPEALDLAGLRLRQRVEEPHGA